MANTPKIRFEGFTDDWEQCKLSEVVTEIKRTDETSDAPVMMITAENGFINQSDRYSTDNAGQSLKKYILLKKGELAYNHGASKLRPYGSCFALTTEKNARIPFVYHCFSTVSENAEFLSIVLNGKAVEKQLRKLVSSGARMDGLLNISFEQYTSIPILLPDVAEQQKIAGYFRNLDNLITLHQRKCDETKELKNYMLQKMFPKAGEKFPEIRFAGFTEEWELRQLGGCCSLITKGTTPPYYSDEGDVTFVKIEAIRGKYVCKHLCTTIDGSIHQTELSRSILKENDIVFAIAGATVGKCAIITGDLLPANTNQALAIIRLKDDIDREFVYNSLTSMQMTKYINESKSVGAQPNLSLAQMNAFEFWCPITIEEQTRIGVYFNNLDNLITLHQRKCDNLKMLKQYMLQNMFPQKG